MSIGQRIGEFRKRKGISLSQLAKESGVSKGYLSALEREGAQNPSVEALAKVARALGVPLHALIEETQVDGAETGPLPEGLRKLVEERRRRGAPLTKDDLEMLLSIRYRGRQPESAEDWAYLYETIRRIIR